MRSQKTDPMSGNNRFQSKVRHYHQSNKTEDVTWDDWIGDKVKGPRQQRIEKVLVGIGTVVIGICLLAGAVSVIYIGFKKVLPMIVK